MRSRLILTIFFAVPTTAVGQSSATAQERRVVSWPNAIVLFGAHWCAPCRGEYRILPSLVAAAAPDRLILAWVDRSATPPSGVSPGVVGILGAEEAQLAADRIGGEGYGLPFTAMFDGSGQVCSIWRKPLRAEDIKTLKAGCRR